MKKLYLLFAVLALTVGPSAFANPGRSSERSNYVIDIKNVQITSYQRGPRPSMTVRNAQGTYTIQIGPNVKVTKTTNGKTRTVPLAIVINGRGSNDRFDIVARRTPHGIIAVLIAL